MRYVIVTLVSLCLAGCDVFYGLFRSAQGLTVAPQDKCVVTVLQSIPDVTNVAAQPVRNGSRPLTLHGIEKPDQEYYYSYEYRGVRHGLVFAKSYKGIVYYSSSLIYINSKPPQELIDKIRPILGPIEKALETQCGVTELTSKVTESCRGVKCGGT